MNGGIASPGRGAVSPPPLPFNLRHQAIDCGAIGGEDLAAGVGIGPELLVQGPLHVAAALEGELETFGIGWRK